MSNVNNADAFSKTKAIAEHLDFYTIKDRKIFALKANEKQIIKLTLEKPNASGNSVDKKWIEVPSTAKNAEILKSVQETKIGEMVHVTAFKNQFTLTPKAKDGETAKPKTIIYFRPAKPLVIAKPIIQGNMLEDAGAVIPTEKGEVLNISITHGNPPKKATISFSDEKEIAKAEKLKKGDFISVDTVPKAYHRNGKVYNVFHGKSVNILQTTRATTAKQSKKAQMPKQKNKGISMT